MQSLNTSRVLKVSSSLFSSVGLLYSETIRDILHCRMQKTSNEMAVHLKFFASLSSYHATGIQNCTDQCDLGYALYLKCKTAY